MRATCRTQPLFWLISLLTFGCQEPSKAIMVASDVENQGDDSSREDAADEPGVPTDEGVEDSGTPTDNVEEPGGDASAEDEPSNPVDTGIPDEDSHEDSTSDDGATGGGTTEDGTPEDSPTEDSEPDLEDEVDTAPPPLLAADYTEPGPWKSGVLTDRFDTSTGLELWVDVWYPTMEAASEPVTYYNTAMWRVTGDGHRDVTPDCTEPRPVMVHSHGSSSTRWEMFPLMEFLASHGWLVIAPDHAGNTYYSSWALMPSLLERRPDDIRQTFNWLVEQSRDSTSPLAGCVDDAAGYVVSGYSLGGYTAYAIGGARVSDGWGGSIVGLSDSRATQVVTHAAWDGVRLIDSGTSDIDVPVLTIGGERDLTVRTRYLDLHRHVRATPNARASFYDAGHFTPVPVYCIAWGDGCGPSYMDPGVYAEITQTSILAFLQHNRGYTGAWEQIVEDSTVVDWVLRRE